MRIFILEDNEYKLNDIKKVLQDAFPTAEIDSCGFFNRGVGMLLKGDYDIAVLDNQLPRFPDSKNHWVGDAASHVLDYVYMEEVGVKCVICSAYDDKTKEASFESLMREYDVSCIGYVRYQNNSSDWAKKLVEIIKKAV